MRAIGLRLPGVLVLLVLVLILGPGGAAAQRPLPDEDQREFMDMLESKVSELDGLIRTRGASRASLRQNGYPVEPDAEYDGWIAQRDEIAGLLGDFGAAYLTRRFREATQSPPERRADMLREFKNEWSRYRRFSPETLTARSIDDAILAATRGEGTPVEPSSLEIDDLARTE